MKRFLCSTSALIAVGLAANEASAASALKLGITGFYRNSIGGTFGGNSPTTQFAGTGPLAQGVGVTTAGLGNFDRQNVSMRQEIRVNFTGETTLDNGITVGVLVGLNGESVLKSGSTTQVDRAYADFSGKFGQIRVGETDSALSQDCILDPGNVTSNFGVNSPYESFSNVGFAQQRNQTTGVANVSNAGGGTLRNGNPPLGGYFSTFGVAPIGSIGTCYGIDLKGNKIAYFSPDFGGFTFGVSYEPQAYSRFAGGGLAYGTDVTAPVAGGGANVLSVAADYQHDFGGVKLTAGGGGEWAFTQYTPAGATTSDKPAWYNLGLQLGFGAWAVGASAAYYTNYAHAGYGATNAASGDDGWVVTAGGSYTIDAWSFGLQGMYANYQQSGAVITGIPFATASDQEYWAVSLNGAYALGPGIALEGQVAYTDTNYGSVSALGVSVPVPVAVGVNASQVSSWEIDFGTAINF
ncbi:MAG TPA: porin [Verrucomicrobiae bacterium]|nr:porin [Verrucomicrobiae bacterium]